MAYKFNPDFAVDRLTARILAEGRKAYTLAGLRDECVTLGYAERQAVLILADMLNRDLLTQDSDGLFRIC